METSGYLPPTQWQPQDSQLQQTIEIPLRILEDNPKYLVGYRRYNIPRDQSLTDQVRQIVPFLYEEKERQIKRGSRDDSLTLLQISQIDQLNAEYRDIRASLERVNSINLVQPLSTSEPINKKKISRPSIEQLLVEKGLDPTKYRIPDSEFDAATSKAHFSTEDWE
jgi:hypothetical protein